MVTKRFVGFYNYTVILTYLGLIAAIFGMTQCLHGRYKTAILCLMIAGLCDAFDGRVARRRTESTPDERSFGVQLDSLCDMICYGIFPVIICYMLGVRGFFGLTCLVFYCVSALIRLAYFNVLEINRQADGGTGAPTTYHGLPVTSISVILPVFFATRFFFAEPVVLVLLHVMLIGVGFAFILDFKLPKLHLRGIIITMAVVLALVLAVFQLTHFQLPAPNDDRGPIPELIACQDEPATEASA